MAKVSCTGLANLSSQIGHWTVPFKTLSNLTSKYLLALATLFFRVKSLNQYPDYARQGLSASELQPQLVCVHVSLCKYSLSVYIRLVETFLDGGVDCTQGLGHTGLVCNN